jgi:hypothetical protein
MIYALFWQNRFSYFKKIIIPIQWLVCILLLIAPVLILIYSFPSSSIWPWLISVGTAISVIILVLNKTVTQKLFSISLALIIGLNFFLSLWFYPEVLQYQAGNVTGRFISKQKIKPEKFFMYKFEGNDVALHFYSKQIVMTIDSINALSAGTYLLTMDEGLQNLRNSGKNIEIVNQGLDYHVTALTGKFLSKETRDQQCKKYYIVKLN